MKRNIIGLIILTGAFVCGFSVNNFAISKAENSYRIAVVDVQDIASNSSEIKSLKESQGKQLEEIQSILEKAKLEISKETNPQKASQLEETYRKQINDKKLAMDTSYNAKLNTINSKIRTAVTEKARSLNYDFVVSKNAVLFGGDDITDKVKALVK